LTLLLVSICDLIEDVLKETIQVAVCPSHVQELS